MKVAHEDDHVTHAILGGGQARDFGISDDPAFFQILSSTLYSNQPLAVVRETLCNGWDAHIEAGKTDVALEITLTDDALIIQDFGKGIADEDMQPIYGVYGGSTKKDNKGVTGGFGLGCKAPFAYSDHFKVTSCHGGKKTIYNLSRSSAEVGGKPGIFPIASFPTEQTGLTVEVPIKSSRDRETFERLIKTVAFNGEILVNLNGKRLNVLPFSKAELGFLVVTGHHVFYSRVSVRLGNVIYPFPEHEELRAVINRARKFVERFESHNQYYSIVFQAPADSLTVTPSRESLSTTDQTIKALTKIVDEAISKAEDGLNGMTASEYREYFKQFQTPAMAQTLFDTSKGFTVADLNKPVMKTKTDLSKRRAAIEILKNDSGENSHKKLAIRVRILTQQGVIDKELGQSFRAALLWGIRHRKASISTSYWLWDRIINPIRTALKAADLPEKRLFFSFEGKSWHADTFTSLETFITDRYRERGAKENFGFARKVVAIGFSKEDIGKRVREYPNVLKVNQAADSLIAYVVPRTFTRIAKVRETFEALGFKVLDFTIRNPWEKDDVLPPVVREVRETKKGLPLLKSIYFNGVFRMPNDPATCDTIKFRETKPKFVLTVARGRQDLSLNEVLGPEASRAVAKLFGDRTALTISSTQQEAYIKKGAKCLLDHLVELVIHEYATNKRIQNHLSRDVHRLNMKDDTHQLILMAENIPALQKIFLQPTNLTEYDRQIIAISRSIRLFDDKRAKHILKATEKVKVNETFRRFVARLDANMILPTLVRHKVLDRFNNPKYEPARPALISMIKTAVAYNQGTQK